MGMKEFIALMACLNALVALSIDAMLPALGVMAIDLQVTRANDIQYVIGCIFIGMAFGQVFYGPLADAIGRKRTLNTGLILYSIGSLISWYSMNLPMMLFGRILQGLGVSAPRIISVAIVRDKFQGRDMAAIMSMVMGMFIMVPAIAPTLGQLIMHFDGWRSIFLFYILASCALFVWFHLRLEETLAPENRRPFSLRTIISGFKEAAATRVTLGYTICSGVAFGGILGYLTSAQQIFQGLFQTGDNFAIYFGILALCIGAAFFSNSAFVRHYGMRKITRNALYSLMVASTLFLLHTVFASPSLLIFMVFMGVSFFCLGLTFGNMNAMGMEPMGHMAGLAAAFIGAGSSLVSLTLGAFIGQMYDGTLLPLAIGFVSLSFTAQAIMYWTEKKDASRIV